MNKEDLTFIKVNPKGCSSGLSLSIKDSMALVDLKFSFHVGDKNENKIRDFFEKKFVILSEEDFKLLVKKPKAKNPVIAELEKFN